MRARAAWLVSVACVLTAVAITVQTQGRAASAARRWGSAGSYWVVARDLPAGRAVTRADVVARALPEALAPDGAVSATVDVTGTVARTVLVAGEPLSGARLLDATEAAAGYRVGVGEVAVEVDAELAPAGLQAGQPVVVVLAPSLDGDPGRLLAGRIVALDPAVTAAGERDGPRAPPGGGAGLLVAVAAADAPTVVAALRSGEARIGAVAPAVPVASTTPADPTAGALSAR